MPRAIVLLCPDEDRFHLAGTLSIHNPDLSISAVSSLEKLENALDCAPADVRLIGFRTPVMVPPRLLDRLSGPAYNFHPAPPEYPGKHPFAFALYDQAASYGATAHEMAYKVDSGPIVGVLRFDLPPNVAPGVLADMACAGLVRLFLLLARHLAVDPQPLPHVAAAWGERRCTQKALDALCELPAEIDAAEFRRRERAAMGARDAALSVALHGRRFILRRQS